jgi:hypothetical protein
MKTLGVAGLSGFGGLLGSWIGMPWQAQLVYALLAAVLTTVVALAQIAVRLAEVTVPQDSHDKVLWLDKLLKLRTIRRDKPATASRREPLQASGGPRRAGGARPARSTRRKSPRKRRRRPARPP